MKCRETLLCILLFWSASCLAQKEALEEVKRLELEGRFQEAAGVLTRALDAAPAASELHQAFEFGLERLDRIRKDFPYSKEKLFAELAKSVKDLTSQEYERWIRAGRFESRTIDGQQRFALASVSNLFFRYPELNARRVPPKDTAALERLHWETCVAIKSAAAAQKKSYVLPKRFVATMTVLANANVAPPGEIIRAWLPIPRDYPFQREFELISTTPRSRHLDTEASSIRNVYLEQPTREDQPTEFKVEYAYTRYGVWFDINPRNVRSEDCTNTAILAFTRQAPHVQFTPEIRALSQKIIGTESNPYEMAKKCYFWVAENIKYSFAIEYSTLRNISDECRANGYGDCGQQALLFITLCRLNGIPARWQSGWSTFPGAKTIHDWTEIYVAPYGWIPVDPYMGVFAMQYAKSLKPAQRRELRDFYFGGLDQYRMAANSDHNQVLNPTKRSLRSDTVDFQRGELEWGSHNIYFDQFSYDLNVKEVSLQRTMQ